MTSFKCRVCGREYSTDSDRRAIVQFMRGNAALCEQQCRQLVIDRFGHAERSPYEMARLYARLTQESPK